ncbi:radical SAM protein [Candidatus Omnitrophota bacterium]
MKSQTYSSFWKQIRSSAKERNFPLRVMFELTYRCNFKCNHCYIPQSYRGKKELATKEVFFILDQLKDIGCFYLGFTGGEPFIRKDFIDILRYAKKKGFQTIIYTNGSLITREISRELKRLGPNKVDITIPGMKKASFEHITQTAGSHRRVFKAINTIRKSKVNLGFKTCILEDNASEIKSIEAFSRSLGAQHRLDYLLTRRLDGSKEPYRYRDNGINRLLERSRLKEDIFEGCELREKNYISSNGQLFVCGAGSTQAAITPTGELKLCLMIDHPRYDILGSSLKECWARLNTFQRSIIKDENYQCNSCKLQSYCKWCPARSWLYNRTFTACVPESRARAKTIYRALRDTSAVSP